MSAAHLRKTLLSTALLSMGLAMGATAQTPSTGNNAPAATGNVASTATAAPSRGASDAKLTHRDKKFLEEAARGGLAEVQLGQLAAQKAQSPEVKQFGQKMADDHSKANDQLKQLASSKGVELPTDLDRSARREHDKLSKMSGDDFDREYMKHMVSDHKKDVKDFADEAKSGKDADVKTWASQTLPTLQQHLQLAQQTDAAVHSASKGSSTMTTSAPAPGQPGSAYGKTGGTGGTTPSTNTKPPKS
jgi:putative membrane protein